MDVSGEKFPHPESDHKSQNQKNETLDKKYIYSSFVIMMFISVIVSDS